MRVGRYILVFTIVSLHVVLIIPGCMLMFKVGKGSPGVLNSIQQKLQLKFCSLGMVHSSCRDPNQTTACYCSCMQVTKELSTGDNNFVKWRGTFQFDQPKQQDIKSKWTTFKAQSWIFQSNQAEMVHSIGWTNRNFWNFGLNGKHPRTPLSQGY